MADQTQSMEIEKQELTTPEGAERTRETVCFVPRADIYQVDDSMVIVVDVPGADESTIDITLEKNTLTITAYVEAPVAETGTLALAEYQVGDYQRSFTLSNEIDRSKIQANVRDGVLRLVLPLAAELQSRKISVKAG